MLKVIKARLQLEAFHVEPLNSPLVLVDKISSQRDGEVEAHKNLFHAMAAIGILEQAELLFIPPMLNGDDGKRKRIERVRTANHDSGVVRGDVKARSSSYENELEI